MDNPTNIAPRRLRVTGPVPDATPSPLTPPAALRAAPYLTPEDVYRQLAGEHAGTSIARAIAAYHAIVTGQKLPPAPVTSWPD